MVLAPAPAEAVFTAPVDLSDAGQNAEEPHVAIDNNGNALAVWERSDGANLRIEARTRSAAGVLGPVQTLSAAFQDAFSPQVAVNGNGNGLVVWTRFNNVCQCDKIQARPVSTAGVVGPTAALSGSGAQSAEEPQVGIDNNGNALAVWTRSDSANLRIQARTRSAAGVLGNVQTLSAAFQNAFSPQVAVNGNGKGLVVWTRFNGACPCDKIQSRPISTAGVVGGTQALSDDGQNAEESQVGIDNNGNALAVWQRFDGANDRVQGRTRSAAGVLGTVQTLSAAFQNAFSPQVAVNGIGNGLVVWTRFNGACPCDKIQSRPVSTAGVVGGTQALSADGQDAEEPKVGIDNNGNGLAVWTRSDGANLRIEARTRSAAAVLGTVQTLSAALQDAFSPQVAVNGAGGALVDWTRFDGAFDRTQAAAGP